MVSYSKAAVERAMKGQEVILRALAKKITWWQAAEIIGISDEFLQLMQKAKNNPALDPMDELLRTAKNRFSLPILEACRKVFMNKR